MQRWRCPACRRRFIEPRVKPLGDMRVPLDKALFCLYLLCEGNSIRTIERVLGLEKKTIIALLLLAGRKCERLMNRLIRGLKVTDVQADEIWGFVGCKQKTKLQRGYGDEMGDAWCYVAVERHTKLVLAWHLGTRGIADTEVFAEKLSRATVGEFQLTTDGWKAYQDAMSLWLGDRVHFAQLVKEFSAAHPQQSPIGQRRYSPAPVARVIKMPIVGHPDPAAVSTSHVERQNLTIRMSMRRMTRLTNGFSKKWENLRLAYALHFAFYNFCRYHKTIRCTPAMAAGITTSIWEIEDLLTR